MQTKESADARGLAVGEALMAEARLAAERAYAPYSGFRVGAAVLGSDGTVHVGANIENASFGLTLCAERAALASAFATGERAIVAIAVACIDALPGAPLEHRMPCGACRQWMQELAPNADVYVLGAKRAFRVAELLPMGFMSAGMADVVD
jgi:cytidine deaminase